MALVALMCIGVGQNNAVPAHSSEQRIDEHEIWLGGLTVIGKTVKIGSFGSFISNQVV